MTGKMKLTKLERAWVLYDVGNSAFILLVSTLFPIYFNAIAGMAELSSVDYLAYWGYATSIVTVLVALTGPILGTMTDNKGMKKPIFTVCMLIGAVGCSLLGFTSSWLVFLVIYIIAKFGYSSSLIFYDAMLGDVTTPERMDDVSSRGFAWGLYRQLRALYHRPWAGAWRRSHRYQPDGKYGNNKRKQTSKTDSFCKNNKYH